MASLMLVNPKKRKKRKSSTKRRKSVSRKRPVRRRKKSVVRRRRRNPSSRAKGGILKRTVIPAATGAVGALGLDLVMGYLPLPEAIKTGPMRHAVKGAAAIGLGMLARNFVKGSTADAIANGALTVVMYNAGKEMAMRFMPNLPLSAYEDFDDDYDDDLGYYSAGYDPSSDLDGLDLEDDQGLMAYEEDSDMDYDLEGLAYVDEDLDL